VASWWAWQLRPAAGPGPRQEGQHKRPTRADHARPQTSCVAALAGGEIWGSVSGGQHGWVVRQHNPMIDWLAGAPWRSVVGEGSGQSPEICGCCSAASGVGYERVQLTPGRRVGWPAPEGGPAVLRCSYIFTNRVRDDGLDPSFGFVALPRSVIFVSRTAWWP